MNNPNTEGQTEKLQDADERLEVLRTIDDALDVSGVRSRARLNDLSFLETGELPPMTHLGTGKVGQRDRLKMADYLGNISANTRLFLMLHGSALTFYNAYVALLNETEGDPNEPISQLGHVLLLDALIASPEAVTAMLRCLRRDLVEVVPELALMDVSNSPVTIESAPAVHAIDGVNFELDPDGSLRIDDLDGHKKALQITPRDAFAMLTFFRMPGVAPLLEQHEARAQQSSWEETLEEMTRDRAYMELMRDPELRRRVQETLDRSPQG